MREPDAPRIGFGAAGIGNHRRALSDCDAAGLLQAAWDAGIRHFDTAPHYGLGLSEIRLGRFLADKPRDAYVLTTKVGRRLEPRDPVARAAQGQTAGETGGETVGETDGEGFVVPASADRVWDFTPRGVRRTLESSLRRLQTEYVDRVYLHDPERWDLDTALETGIPALIRVREAGLTRRIGVASMSTEVLLRAGDHQEVEALMIAGRLTLATPDLPAEALARWADRGLELTAAAVFNGGLLSRPLDASSTFDYADVPEDLRHRVRRLQKVCAAHGVSPRVAALHYPLSQRGVDVVVVGGDTPDQVRQNAADVLASVPEELWIALRDEELIA